MRSFDLRRCHSVLVGVALASLMPVTTSAGVPVLNSDYRAPHVIYLDFDGHVESAAPHLCPLANGAFLQEGYTQDVVVGDVSADLDTTLIAEIWEAVAEDFAPFEVNVTTDPAFEPGPESARAVRVAIGLVRDDLLRKGELGFAPPICAADSLQNPAYLNPYIAHVVVVHLDPSYEVYAADIAKRISHEAGHLYGLIHHTAAAGLLDDWIMALQRSAPLRYVWRKGYNEKMAWQDDVEQLAHVLGRRSDEANPANLRSFITLNATSGLYAHATFAHEADLDDFLFTVGRAGQLNFEIIPGVWTSPIVPTGSVEPVEANARYLLQVRSGDGRVLLACPEATTFTLSAVTQPTIATNDCLNRPATLLVGSTYRLRVIRHSNSRLPGNVGRYTVIVRSLSAQQQPPSLTLQ